MKKRGKLERLAAAFSDWKTLAKAALYAVAILLILGIPTALIPNPVFHRMTPSNALDYFFLLTTSLLAGAYLAIPAKTCPHDVKAAGGGVLGLLAFACPICDKLLVLLLGATFLMAYFDPIRPLLGVISIVLLLYAIDKKIGKSERKELTV